MRQRDTRCWLDGCSEERESGPFCHMHWDQLPDDLQYRIQWEHENGTTESWRAAVGAAVRYLRDDI